MSIRDIFLKIKDTLASERVFVGALIILIGVASFGLGRLSVTTLPTVRSIQKEHRPTSTLVTVPEKIPQEATITPVASNTDDGTYVGSKQSDKYHLPWCSGAARISDTNKVWFASKTEAEAARYKPAGNCPGI